MTALSLQDLRERLRDDRRPAWNPAIRGFNVDSRRIRGDEVFFALQGRSADGHRFVADALDHGAACAVVRQDFVSSPGIPEERVIRVDDPLAALHAIARGYRDRNFGRVVAITGSNGKTIVKDALVAILSARSRVSGSPGSYNSQIGVPLSVLAALPDSEIGVFEAGISAPGEMRRLRGLLRPDVGVLTNVGLAHIASFRDREALAAEKMSLFAEIPADGWVLLPSGDPLVSAAAHGLACRTITWGVPSPDLPFIEDQAVVDGLTQLTVRFPGEVRRCIPVQTRSRHLIDDLGCALAAAHLLGATPDDCATALDGFRFGPTRMEFWRSTDGVTLVNDAYSSDPLSVQAALRSLGMYGSNSNRRIFIFGGMKDLGAWEEQEHRVIGTVAASSGFTHLVVPDTPALRFTAESFQQAKPDGAVIFASSPDEIRRDVHGLAGTGDLILVKGPRNEGLAATATSIWESMAPAKLVVDLSAIRGNVRRIKQLCGPEVKLLAMLKAWAYSTDLSRFAAWIQGSGIDLAGVSTADEGALARRSGVLLPILVMMMDAGDIDKVVRHRLTPVVYAPHVAHALAKAAENLDRPLEVHLEVDTGMGRLGVLPDEVDAVLETLVGSRNLRVTGILSHFACADDPCALDFTTQQMDLFEDLAHRAESRVGRTLVKHLAATAGAILVPRSRLDMVRIGIGLYGVYPSAAVREALDLEPALTFLSKIAQVKRVQRGTRVGYGSSYVVDRDDLLVGTVEVGYNDGVPRNLSNRGHVLVAGRKAPIIGRISMDSLTIDLSACPNAQVGDDVLLFGRHDGHELRLETVAAMAETIPYEILVRVDSRRVQRIFVGE